MPFPAPPAEAPLLLIAAISGRALAASARRGGYRTIVLDCFGDRDTRAAAERWRAVAAPQSLHFDRRALLDAASALAPGAPLVYGSGFEGRTALLARLAEGRELCGNHPSVVAAVKDPSRFFPLLDTLGIRHPEVRYTQPADPGGWLLKQGGGAGGTHVRPADRHPARPHDYFQRIEMGRTMSALFLADARRALIIGFNEQWTNPVRPGSPYLFGGAVGRVAVAEGVGVKIRDGLDALVAATGLVGLNGLDFLLEGERWSVLEINPRPTATMELYDPDYDRGLVDRHLDACHGVLPAAAVPGPSRAQSIVHADAGWRVEEAFSFPSWCRDIPNPETTIQPGDPVCTVHAEADGPELAVTLARSRERELKQMIGG